MTREEVLKRIIEQEGECNRIGCDRDNCPFESNAGLVVNCGNHNSDYGIGLPEWHKEKVRIAKEMLGGIMNIEDKLKELEEKQREIADEMEKLRKAQGFKVGHFYEYSRGGIICCTDIISKFENACTAIVITPISDFEEKPIGCIDDIWGFSDFHEVRPTGWEKV